MADFAAAGRQVQFQERAQEDVIDHTPDVLRPGIVVHLQRPAGIESLRHEPLAEGEDAELFAAADAGHAHPVEADFIAGVRTDGLDEQALHIVVKEAVGIGEKGCGEIPARERVAPVTEVAEDRMARASKPYQRVISRSSPMFSMPSEV